MQQYGPLGNWRTQFYAVFALISLFFALGTIGVVWWIATSNTIFPSPPPPTNTTYVNYDLSGNYISQASSQAIQAYIAQYPQPQNVQILQGYSTAEIYGYMQTFFSGGLKVDCSYCHNLANFAEEHPKKTIARNMLLMTGDLNQNWVAKLPASAGNKAIICATCHNGKPLNFNGAQGSLTNYPSDQAPLPDTWMLPLDNLDSLIITGEDDPNLDEVQNNQYTMNHMNYSLGVGCAFCHNANYFPSNEKPQKGWALTMLQMSAHIQNTYGELNNGKGPSCWMCHQQQQIPPGSAAPGSLPSQITYTSSSATQ